MALGQSFLARISGFPCQYRSNSHKYLPHRPASESIPTPTLELTWVDQRSPGMLHSVDWYSYRRFGTSYRSHLESPSLLELLDR